MDFNYQDFLRHDFYRPDTFRALGSVSPESILQLQKDYDKEGKKVVNALWQLHRRTTPDYFRKVYRAQTEALTYSKKVFPTYKFIMPDALADDWLSTVDWHKEFPTRDHSLHQTLTAYIVAKLLGNGDAKYSLKLPHGRNLLDWCVDTILDGPKMAYFRNYAGSLGADYKSQSEGMQRMWAKDLFYETAVTAALFHDMGYPWQYVNRLAKSIEVAEYSDSMTVVTSAKITKDAIKNRLLVLPFYGYSETNMRHASSAYEKEVMKLIDRGLKESHGLPGALGFMCLNDKTRSYHQIPPIMEASYRLLLDWAALGIMMHDMKDLYWDDKDKIRPKNKMLRLSFDVDPLSSIIAMADILEEFQRPSANFRKTLPDSQSVDLSYDFPCVGVKIRIRGCVLHFFYSYNSSLAAASNKKRRTDEITQYFDPSNGYVDLSPLGIKDTVCVW